MLRQPRRIFAQERAERVMSKPKPTMHPLYPTEEKIIKRLKAEHPELGEKISEHIPVLDERVGKLRISSKEVAQLEEGEIPKIARPLESGNPKDVRLLPQARMTPPTPELGFYEPPENKVAPGRILFSKAKELLEMRESEPEKAIEFAKRFGIDEKDAASILKYFVPFTKFVNLPDENEKRLPAEDDVFERELIGRRAILQKQRVIGELEQRMTAKLTPRPSEETENLKETKKDDQKK